VSHVTSMSHRPYMSYTCHIYMSHTCHIYVTYMSHTCHIHVTYTNVTNSLVYTMHHRRWMVDHCPYPNAHQIILCVQASTFRIILRARSHECQRHLSMTCRVCRITSEALAGGTTQVLYSLSLYTVLTVHCTHYTAYCHNFRNEVMYSLNDAM
jgi:hypothetical protein